MNIKKVNAGVWVKCSYEMPIKDESKPEPTYYYTDMGEMWLNKQHKTWYFPGMSVSQKEQPTAWLKPVEGYVLSEEQLEKSNTDYAEWLELQGYHIKGMDNGQRAVIYKQFLQSINQQ